MIESVSTSSVQSVALRSSPQSFNAVPASAAATQSNFISSRVVVDNLLNAAILEYRSSDGTVVAQYPTAAQIQAFHRAEKLAEDHAQNAQIEHLAAPSGGGRASPAPSPATSAPAPTTSDIIAAAAAYSPPAAPGSNSTQSITA